MHAQAKERNAGVQPNLFSRQENRDLAEAFRNLTPEQLRFYENLAEVATAERDRFESTRWKTVTRKRTRQHAFGRQGHISDKIMRLQSNLKAEGLARAALAKQKRAELFAAREAAGRELSASEVGPPGPPHFTWSPGPFGRLDWLPPVADVAKVWI